MAGRAQEDLVVRIRLEDARFGPAMKKLERGQNKFVQTNKKVRTTVKRTRDEFGKFSKTAKSAGKSSGLFGGSLGGIGAKALSLLGPMASITGAFFLLKSAFSAVMDAGRFAEDTITTLGVALGSERAGVEAFKKSLDFSIITPFDPRAIAQATEFAVAFGIKDPFQKGVDGLAEDVSLQQLAAGIASFSQDKDIVNAMKGILVPEKEVIKRWGGEVLGVYNQIIKGGIALDTPAFQKAWLEGLSRIDKFKKAAGAASQTVTGLMSTIGGNIGNIALFFTGAGEGKDARSFWNFLRGVLGQVNEVFGKFMKIAGPFLIEIGAQLGGLFKDIFDILVDVGKVVLVLLLPSLIQIGVALTVTFFVIRGIVKWFKFVLNLYIRIIVATAKWVSGLLGIKDVFNETSDFFRGILDFANDTFAIFELILKRFNQAIDDFISTIEKSGPFKAINDVLKKFASFAGLEVKGGTLTEEEARERDRLANEGKLRGDRGLDRAPAPRRPASESIPFGDRRGRPPQPLRPEDRPRPVGGGKQTVHVTVMPEQAEQLKNNIARVVGKDVIFERDFVN